MRGKRIADALIEAVDAFLAAGRDRHLLRERTEGGKRAAFGDFKWLPSRQHVAIRDGSWLKRHF